MAEVYKSVEDFIEVLKNEGVSALRRTNAYKKNPQKVLDADLQKAAEELRQTIMDNFRVSYSKVAGHSGSARGLIDKPKLEEEKMTITMEFTDVGYRRNLFDTHDSFLPILLDYGWSVHGSKSPNNMFMHYEGDRFIRRAIENFNSKYASSGIYATLKINGKDYMEYSESNKIPYKANEK